MSSLNGLLTQFQADLLRQGRQRDTAAAYMRDVRRFVTWYELKQGVPWRLTAITPEHGRAYRDDFQHIHGLEASTINRHLAGLRVFLDWAVAAGYLAANPLARVAGLPVSVGEPVWLERTEQQWLMVVMERTVNSVQTRPAGAMTPALEQIIREQAVVLTLLHTGMGINELVELEVTDVTLAENGGSLCVRPSGWTKSARMLALNAEVREALARYLAVRPPKRSERLFVGQRGALSARQVQHILQKWARAASIPSGRLTAQALRHTFGHNLVQAGVPLDQVGVFGQPDQRYPNRGSCAGLCAPGQRSSDPAAHHLAWRGSCAPGVQPGVAAGRGVGGGRSGCI
jgi:site-specific recombinase XerD